MFKQPSFSVTYFSSRQREVLLSELRTWDHISQVEETQPYKEKVTGIEEIDENTALVGARIIEHPGIFKVYRLKTNISTHQPVLDEGWHNCYVSLIAVERACKNNRGII